MRRTLRALLLLLLASASAGGCYTEYQVRPACRRAVFIPGHYGPFGRWHPAHWRCR